MSQKGPKVGQGMLDFVEDLRYEVVSYIVINNTTVQGNLLYC